MHDATRAGSGQLRALVDDHSYDAIVVGTGISGGWAAKELTEKGLKTLVLDRGRMVRHGDYPTAMKDPWELPYGGRATQEDLRRHAIGARSNVITQASKHWFVDDLDNPYTEIQRFDWIRGYHVGGRSIMWGRQSYRWSPMDFEANARDGIAVDWPIRYEDRPVDRNAVARIRLEIHRAPAITLPAPHDGAPADVVAAYPVEALNLGVRIVQVVDEPVLGGLRDHIAARADGMTPEILLRGAAPVGQLPGILHGGWIVAMPDHAPAIEHKGLQSLLGQLLGGPAAADARTDDDGIVGVVVHGSALNCPESARVASCIAPRQRMARK